MELCLVHFPDPLCQLGVINKDPTVWLDRARPHSKHVFKINDTMSILVMTLHIMTLLIMTLHIMTLLIMTLHIMTLHIMTLLIMTLHIMTLI